MEVSLERYPSVEIVIPHFGRRDMLERCLESLEKTRYPSMRITVVDNSGKAAGLVFMVKRFRNAQLLRLDTNRGYAGGCNEALRLSDADFVVFMNDDTVHDPLWLEKLVEGALCHEKAAAFQPKILSMKAASKGKRVFDYAGAAGGMMDRLGYPWCLGRVFSSQEEDRGQYDESREIFWASGAAMLVRRQVAMQLGGFDGDFFMHMEEIDLCWRMKLAGYEVLSVPGSLVWHEGGASLAAGSAEKIYYNHRNNIAMILKNRGTPALLWSFPLRIALEAAAAVFYLTQYPQALKKSHAVLRAALHNFRDREAIVRKRRAVQASRVTGDRKIFQGLPLTCFSKRKPGHVFQL
ncbi:MAG: glycosyltransferase family 2 protein [Chlorobiaceae bacterium]|nr:glycosyltransferase family 2 protein [Chlorobiaceae bacterium]NTV61483.1 glycosyltransferase family 2 protein [Chlorobiaceae bacterium]